ncbi:hypothetical protein [Limnohabitans sp.]|uniref:hypothetical protein n=1 Tax=Limnohabitans sp. TaxID=1907725 RepID=UPI00286F37CB|nr:hypothetical protein [Limnohabitans sp.]
MSKQTKGTGNVRLFPVAKETKIEPPPEHESRFKARGSRLQMRSGVSEKEKLVSLYDVVAWLVTDCEIPLKPAIRQVVTKVKAIDVRDIFCLRENDYAKPYNPDSPWHIFLDAGGVPARPSVQFLEMYASELSRLVNAPGEKPEFDESKETPFEYFGRTDSVMFALTWHKANEVFGWGRKASASDGAMQGVTQGGWSEIVAIKRDNKNAPLSLEQKQALAKEFEGRSGQGVAKAMAAELGISVTAFNELKKCNPGKRMKNKQRNGIDTVVLGHKAY